MSAATLEVALRAQGIACHVEARDRLAIVVPESAAPNGMPDLASREARERVLALAREHGFTHLALELPAPPHPSHAGVSGD